MKNEKGGGGVPHFTEGHPRTFEIYREDLTIIPFFSRRSTIRTTVKSVWAECMLWVIKVYPSGHTAVIRLQNGTGEC